LADNITVYVTPLEYSQTALWKEELEHDILPCIKRCQEKVESDDEQLLGIQIQTQKPRAGLLHDGAIQQVKAVINEDGTPTDIGKKFLDANVGIEKLSAQCSMNEQPLDLGKAFPNLKGAAKIEAYRNRDLEALYQKSSLLMQRGIDKFRATKIPKASRLTFERCLLQAPENCSAISTMRVQQQGFEVAGIRPENISKGLSFWSGWSELSSAQQNQVKKMINGPFRERWMKNGNLEDAYVMKMLPDIPGLLPNLALMDSKTWMQRATSLLSEGYFEKLRLASAEKAAEVLREQTAKADKLAAKEKRKSEAAQAKLDAAARKQDALAEKVCIFSFCLVVIFNGGYYRK
jgi:hypothetical protein